MRDAVKKHWMLFGIAAACYVGYRYPAAGKAVGPQLSWLVGTVMFLMGMGIGFRRLQERINAWPQNTVTVGICYLLAPVVAFGLGLVFFRPESSAFSGLILIGTTSTTLSTCIVYTRLSGGDEALALWLSVTSAFLCSFVSPLLLEVFLGASVTVPVGMMMKRLFFVLLCPLSAGMLLRTVLGEQRVAPLGGLLMRSCVLIILTVIMVSVAEGKPLLSGLNSLAVLAAVALLHLVLLAAAGAVASAFAFSRPERIAILFCAAQKTLQIPAYIAIEVLSTPEAALAPVVFHVFQLTVDSLFISYFSSRNR